MRVLILNTDYPDFLDWHYRRHPGLAAAPYAVQMQARNDSLYGAADFFSRNLRACGCEAWEVHANNAPMQRAWAREHGIDPGGPPPGGDGGSPAPPAGGAVRRWLARRLGRRVKPALPAWYFPLLAAEIEHYRPDVVLNHDMYTIPGRFLAGFGGVRLVAGQIAAPFSDSLDVAGYRLVISSLPHFVERFRARGVASALVRLGFDPIVLARVAESERDLPVLFVGSLSPAHASRVGLLEHLCRNLPIEVWACGADWLPRRSPIRRHLKGAAFGIDMYRLLRRAKVTINHHIDDADGYANNLRLYEATGMGTLLVTDWKSNLGELFEPEAEVAAYRGAEECVELVRRYLGDEPTRAAVAGAGQRRTLSEHTDRSRMAELARLFERHL